MPNGVFLIVES